LEIDNGPHLLAGAYKEFFAYLARVGVREGWTKPRRLRVPLWSRTTRHVLEWQFPRSELGLLLGLIGVVSLRDLAGAFEVVLEARSDEQAPDRPLSEFLDAHRQSTMTREWLWHPLVRAVFNETPNVISARLFAGMLRRLLGEGARAAVLHQPRVGLSNLHAIPAARYVTEHGGAVRHPCPVAAVRGDGSGFTVDSARGSERARAACLAVPADAAARLLPFSALACLPELEAATRVPHSPLVTANLWIEGEAPVLGEPFAGLVDAEFSWVFDFGSRVLDTGPARHVALIAPGSRELADEAPHRVLRRARQTLEAYAPIAARATIDTRVVKEMRAAPSLTPEVEAGRPQVVTPIAGLALAGDWTATGLPATLEGAAWSGHRAAEALDRWLAGAGA
jgi:protoporphyrinogen oxidase